MSNIISMDERSLLAASEMEREILKHEQADIGTVHTIHGGVYTRTIKMEADSILAGALIKIPTTLIVQGDCKIFVGDDKVVELRGHNVIPASSNRKQVIMAITDVYITMVFSTDARSVNEAEMEMTDDYERLMSRMEGSQNKVTITEE